MKLRHAIYQVVLGRKDKDADTDNWSSESVLAFDVPSAVKQVKLERGEYVSEVRLLNRVTA